MFSRITLSFSRIGHLLADSRRGLRGAPIAPVRHRLIRPYHFAWASKLPFLGYERPWNAGYGSVSSARGWLTVIGRSAFRDDSTAN